jgi:hypothetical protein
MSFGRVVAEMQQLMQLRQQLPEDAREQGQITLRLRQLEEMLKAAGLEAPGSSAMAPLSQPGQPPTGGNQPVGPERAPYPTLQQGTPLTRATPLTGRRPPGWDDLFGGQR